MFSSNSTIQEICISLGFRRNEAAILMAMLEIGPAKITAISQKANLARQTSFYILESFLKEKLVSETRKKEDRLFFTNTRLLEEYFKKKEQQTRNAKKSVSKIKNLLKDTDASGENLPKVEYYRGKIGLIHLLQDILEVAKSARNKEFRAYALSAFYPGMEEQFKDFVLQRDKLGVTSKVIVPINTNFTKILGENTYKREFRKINIQDDGAALYIIGSRIYLFSYTDNVGVMIENKTMAKFLISIFDNHWAFLSQK